MTCLQAVLEERCGAAAGAAPAERKQASLQRLLENTGQMTIKSETPYMSTSMMKNKAYGKRPTIKSKVRPGDDTGMGGMGISSFQREMAREALRGLQIFSQYDQCQGNAKNNLQLHCESCQC